MAPTLDDVSVIVPTKDERAHLPAFLASLPAAVELVVVDASRDGTDRLAEQLRPQRTLVIRSPLGIAAGVPAASGSNMGVRRDVFAAVSGFREDLPVNEDTDLMMRVARAGFRVLWRPELAVRSLDDRRLRAGATFKSVHSLTRGLLLLVDHRLALPRRWLAHDWGYWRRGRPPLAPPAPPGAR
jgi:hypothetical protein